jgi:hypothetical protein
MSAAVSPPPITDPLLQQAEALEIRIRDERTKLAARYRKLRGNRKFWQTAVVLSSSLSTGLAGYMAQQGIALSGRLVLAVVVAIAGAVAAIRDAWRVNEEADDAKERYAELRVLSFELSKAKYEAAGMIRPDDRAVKLAPVNAHVQSRLDDLADELAEIAPAKS